MRTRSVATALVAFSAGVTASAVLRRLVTRRAVPAPLVAVPAVGRTVPVRSQDAVVLPFAPRVAEPAPQAPGRCGDTGGRTKAGAPCGARATAGGRCHHHRLAA